jgi:AraC family transcriptional regulator of adaptative response / DNA-3-methyladenine glycosylase II
VTPIPDFDQCYRAVASRDGRFDGWFFTAVTSTGIYCRPSCPALTPKQSNVRFYPSVAAAQQAGFRACMRCRPDATPGSPDWDIRADVVGRAMRMIADGVVDRDGVVGLAARLGYTERHLNRMLVAEVGASPIALARAQRAQTARILIETTDLGFAEIAFAAGFGSVRQFNDTVRTVYATSPSQLRQRARREPASVQTAGPVPVSLRLAYRPPLAVTDLLGFLAARALPGVELVSDDTYQRGMRLPHGTGTVALTPRDGYVAATLHLADLRDLAPAVNRCRRLLDLDADPVAVDGTLAADPALTADITATPGVRVPRSVDGFEMACRAVVGQQVSVASARRVLARMAAELGEPVSSPDSEVVPDPDGEPVPDPDDVPGRAPGVPLERLFPTPEAVSKAPDEALPMPAARRRTLRSLADAVTAGDVVLDPSADRDTTRRTLLALPGIGPWTVAYIAMRGFGDPDAFLATDLAVRRGAARLGLPDAATELETRSRRWGPWRSYAVVRLWRWASGTRPTPGTPAPMMTEPGMRTPASR